jgi:preprotein translocase subunit SecF
MMLAFLLMAIVIFIIFRNPLPCFYVILCAATDIIIPMAIVNMVGIKVSTAGIAAFLMLIGYSVDTDILLTTRVLRRRENPLFKRITGAMKTGLTMTLTSLFAVLVAYFIAIPPVLKQVFIILTIGLCIDIIATWLGNASMLKWYCDRKHIE